jgi:hypothetical protein
LFSDILTEITILGILGFSVLYLSEFPLKKKKN